MTGSGARRASESAAEAGGTRPEATNREPLRALMGFSFFPRGGSAYVARALAERLPGAGVEVSLVSASLGSAGDRSHAPTFFAGLEPSVVRIGEEDGAVPSLPYLPSYEDTGAPGERSFARIDDRDYARIVDVWARALVLADARRAKVFHLHHLTPIHEAAGRLCPETPVVSQLHGTELRLLERIREGPPAEWQAARAWERRMLAWARGSSRLLASSRALAARAADVLGAPEDRFAVIPNGVDVAVFDRRPIVGRDRLAHWRRCLVEQPRGSRPGGEPGSLRYRDEELAPFAGPGPVLLYVGRFTDAKRLPLLLQALARARRRVDVRAPLVLVGGFPGELEGRHPLELVEELALEDVFLAGWYGQDEVAAHMNASDLLVLPSAEEAFGLVLVEAMACGIPVVASNRGGPTDIVSEQTGWVFRADDEASLTDVLVDAIIRDDERRRRGIRAYEDARARFSWEAVAATVADLYRELASPQALARTRT